MAKPLCSSENSSYSSPVPYIGLYIAGATLLCLMLMFSDMISSFRRRNRYLSCNLFSINSVTLFLLATASKLPVDLTTYMPSARDQLSKLSSTAMVCVSIGFLVPSFGSNREAESITNLIALILMVITIVVNVCIQIYTGVIFSSSSRPGWGPTSGHTQIKAVHKNSFSTCLAKARLQSFKIFSEAIATKSRDRAGANVKYAWIGASKDELFRILNFGFSHCSIPYEMKCYGHGLYLCPQNRLLDA
ncbi:hypothetical protein Scep_010749 [Stephania cephalantha]|uniref:Uncharacterized protein n=1 Tax=Stephania cephalantha TaxID=152367 RepID=A0AAP0PDL1_9MAGN